jgi:hypothetical protein
MRQVVAKKKSSRHGRDDLEQTGVSHGAKQRSLRERQPHNQLRLFVDAAQVFLWIKNTQNPRVRFSPGRNSEVWRVHLVYVASGITSTSRQSRLELRNPGSGGPIFLPGAAISKLFGSYRELNPSAFCNLLSRECFCSKETLAENTKSKIK